MLPLPYNSSVWRTFKLSAMTRSAAASGLSDRSNQDHLRVPDHTWPPRIFSRTSGGRLRILNEFATAARLLPTRVAASSSGQFELFDEHEQIRALPQADSVLSA